MQVVYLYFNDHESKTNNHLHQFPIPDKAYKCLKWTAPKSMQFTEQFRFKKRLNKVAVYVLWNRFKTFIFVSYKPR